MARVALRPYAHSLASLLLKVAMSFGTEFRLWGGEMSQDFWASGNFRNGCVCVSIHPGRSWDSVALVAVAVLLG